MIVLYMIVNRELVFVKTLDMDMPTDCDSWLHANGYGRDFTLRRGKVIPITKADIAALGKPSVPLPSYAKMMIEKLSRK